MPKLWNVIQECCYSCVQGKCDVDNFAEIFVQNMQPMVGNDIEQVMESEETNMKEFIIFIAAKLNRFFVLQSHESIVMIRMFNLYKHYQNGTENRFAEVIINDICPEIDWPYGCKLPSEIENEIMQANDNDINMSERPQ